MAVEVCLGQARQGTAGQVKAVQVAFGDARSVQSGIGRSRQHMAAKVRRGVAKHDRAGCCLARLGSHGEAGPGME